MAQNTGTQVPGARSFGLLNFTRWRLIFVNSQCGIFFMLLCQRLEFWDGEYIFGNFVHH